MSSTNSKVAKAMKCLLATVLIVPNMALAAPAGVTTNDDYSNWLFPDDKLPGNQKFIPMSVGSNSSDDIKVRPVDWFLLKDETRALDYLLDSGKYKYSQMSNGQQKTSYYGPVLSKWNAQQYYRIVVGLTLQETLRQMGADTQEARRFVDRAAELQTSFDKTPLNKMGRLPRMFDEMYRNWNRASSRLAKIPYLLLPLATGLHETAFRHFYIAGLNEGNKRCENIETLAPLNTIHKMITAKQAEADKLVGAYEVAKSLVARSNNKIIKLTGDMSGLTSDINKKSSCVNSIKSRVQIGASMPSADCMSLAGAMMNENESNKKLWKIFVSKNITNDKGDQVVESQKNAVFEALQADLENKQERSDTLEEQSRENTAKSESYANDLKKLNEKLKEIEKEKQELNAEYASKDKRFKELQKIDTLLAQGSLNLIKTPDEVKAIIENTENRSAEINELQKRLPQIVETTKKLQDIVEASNTQKSHVNTQVQKLKYSKISIDNEYKQLQPAIAKLEEQVDVAEAEWKQARDRNAFSRQVIARLMDIINATTEVRDSQLASHKKEEQTKLQYQKQLQAASNQKSSNFDKIEAKITGLEGLLKFYRGENHMGSYLETSCMGRTADDQDQSGIYLSRSQMDSRLGAAALRSQRPVSAGKWGMFNARYSKYASAMDAGLPLNVPGYIRFSVEEMFKNYDLVSNNALSVGGKSCESDRSSQAGRQMMNFVRGAHALWSSAQKRSTKNSSYCKRSKEFKKSLESLVVFKNSILDKVLPAKSSVFGSEVMVEREALEALTRQAAQLTGLKKGRKARREQVIKSLIKVMAKDYRQEITETLTEGEKAQQFNLVGVAPGANLVAKNKIAVGDVVKVKALDSVDLYKQPKAVNKYKSGQTVRLGDRVKVEGVKSNSGDLVAMRSKWMRVSVQGKGQQVYWMPAWAVTYGGAANADGRRVYKVSEVTSCRSPRLVEKLDAEEARVRSKFVAINAFPQGKRVVRFSSLPKNYVKREEIRVKNPKYSIWNGQSQYLTEEKLLFRQVSFSKSIRAGLLIKKDTSADKTFVACDVHSWNDDLAAEETSANRKFQDYNGFNYLKMFAVRIVEAVKIQGVDGKTRYVPVEKQGGYVDVWMGDEFKSPRIILGKRLNSSDWSVR